MHQHVDDNLWYYVPLGANYLLDESPNWYNPRHSIPDELETKLDDICFLFEYDIDRVVDWSKRQSPHNDDDDKISQVLDKAYQRGLDLVYSLVNAVNDMNTAFGLVDDDIDDPHWVYIARQSDTIKIGNSNNPERRIKGLQTGSAYPITLVHVAKFRNRWEALDAEAEIHNVGDLARQRLSGEWFQGEFLSRAIELMNNTAEFCALYPSYDNDGIPIQY